MTIKEIRRQSGLSQTKFSKEMGIPLKTLKNWEQNIRKPPRYVENLIREVLVSRGYVITENRADTVSDIKRTIAPVAEKYGLKRIVLFGSRARGDFNGKSDYDFYIEGGSFKGLGFVSFTLDLEELFGSSVDVISHPPKDKYLADAIKNEGVVVYGE